MRFVSRWLVLPALAFALMAAPVRAQEMSARASDRCTRAAVRIEVTTSALSSVGSGSIIDEHGYVLTNFHVVGHVRHGEHGGPGTFFDGDHVQIATVTSARDTATTRYIGRVVRGDVRLDMALIRIVANADGTPIAAGTTFPTVPMTTTAAIRPGTSLWAFGYPQGVRTINVTGGHMTGFQMSAAGGSDPEVSWIRTDVEFNPGNSGGMLVDRQGRLVAIPTAVVSRETIEPIELARPVERMPAEWRAALERGSIDDVVVTGIMDLPSGAELVDHAYGDTGGLSLEQPEVLYYRVPSDRPGMITVTPSMPIGLIGPSGDIGREGRGSIPLYPHDPTSLTLAVLVERSSDGTPVDLHLRFDPTTAPPAPSYPPGYASGRPTAPGSLPGYGRVPYPPGYGPPPVAGPPVSVHGRVIDAASGSAVSGASVMIARPGADLASTLALVSAGRMTQAQLLGQLLATTQTDADGYYTLANVPRGRFSGAAVITGYTSAMITVTIGPADPLVIEALPIQLSH